MRIAALALALAGVVAVAPAVAQDAKKADKKEKVVPKDPDNVKGISPYEEQIAEGKKYAAAQNWGAAAAAFEKAIGINVDDARGYLLLAQAKRDADVMAIIETARSKKGTEPVEAKILFVRAELLERKASLTPTASGPDLAETLKSVWDTSVEAWNAYSAYVAAHTRAPDYSATATDRKQKIDEREKREQQYAVVKAKKDNK